VLPQPPLSYTPGHLAEKIFHSRSAPEGERKQVTVLFADLKGSMELLADRDPEEARQLLDPVLERMMAAVHRYEGTVNQVMGDGIMALFGAPIAHEDHAGRSCYAALAVQASVKQYAAEVQRTKGVPVHIRVGLNAGEVVVRSIGSDLHMDYTAVGQTTPLAARMEQMAKPGSILITPEVVRLAEGYVKVDPLGPMPIKGLQAPLEVYEVTGAGPVRSRLEAAAARGLTRFVGRDAELHTLHQALRQAGARALWPSAYREAVAWFEQALEALQHLPESQETREQAVDVRLDLSRALHFLGERERVLAYLNEAEPLAEALRDRRRLGRVLAFMANAFLMVGDAPRALTASRRALASGADLGDIGLEAIASFCLGEAYHALGEYGQAIEVLRGNLQLLQGVPRFERFGMGTIVAVAAGTWLAWGLAEQGAFAEGLAYGDEALQIAEAADHPLSVVTASFGVGLLCLRKGDPPNAIPVLERGLRLCQDLEIGGWFVDVAPVLGAAYLQSGRLAGALPLLERAVERAASIRHIFWQALRESWLSEAYLLSGRVEKALRLAEQALKHAQDRQERGYQAWVLRLLGEIHAQQDALAVAQAETSDRQALALAEALGMRPLQAHCHLGLGTLYAKIGRRSWEPGGLARPCPIALLWRSVHMGWTGCKSPHRVSARPASGCSERNSWTGRG
jgi:class 3 adenylate cyclase